ncbi:MAG: hypothetical protein SGI94_02410 [Saprospiraceae bacterium]|nr:hypothetical protein [Saprospiraceae bacterium]
MKKILGLFLLLTGFSILLSAQSKTKLSAETLQKLDQKEDTLALLAYAIVNDSLPENRFGTCRVFIPKLVEALKTENSFQYPFDRVKAVSIQYAPDSTFRIFTWQLYVDTSDYRYYGAIQMNTPELKLFPLVDRSYNLKGDLEQAVLTPEEWYGALYYNIREVKSSKGKYYLLFGYDGFSFFHKRKLIDVLTFQPDGKPQFGAPVFVHEKKGQPTTTKNRVMLQFSSESSVKLSYEETMEMIVFDHLISMGGAYGQGESNFPDGSYEAYELKGGLWKHKEMLPVTPMDQAPRPSPVLDTRKKDILGKEDVKQ